MNKKAQIILLSEEQKDCKNVLFFDASAFQDDEIPFQLAIKADLENFCKKCATQASPINTRLDCIKNEFLSLNNHIPSKNQTQLENKTSTKHKTLTKHKTPTEKQEHLANKPYTETATSTKQVSQHNAHAIYANLLTLDDSATSCHTHLSSYRQNSTLDALSGQHFAPIYITDTATSSLDVAHFLVRHLNSQPPINLSNNLSPFHFLGKTQKHFPPFTSIICRNQTQGRGQLRRNWMSPEGNIYAALFLPNTSPFSTESAAPALGAMLVHALRKLGFDVYLKWPNDIIQKNADHYEKIAGILLEERNDVLIAGIGINIMSAPHTSQLRDNFFIQAGMLKKLTILQKIIFLRKKTNRSNIFLKNPYTLLIKYHRLQRIKSCKLNSLSSNFLKIIPLWTALVEQIFLCYRNQIVISNSQNTKEELSHEAILLTKNTRTSFLEYPFSWQELATKYLAFMGEEVSILHPIIKENLQNCFFDTNNNYIRGKVCGINAQGELLLQINNQIITILGGSFSQENRA